MKNVLLWLKTIKVVNDVDFSHTVYLISITFENKIPILQLTDLTSVNFSVTISKHLALTHDFVQITCIDTHFCLKEEYSFLSTFRNKILIARLSSCTSFHPSAGAVLR